MLLKGQAIFESYEEEVILSYKVTDYILYTACIMLNDASTHSLANGHCSTSAVPIHLSRLS